MNNYKYFTWLPTLLCRLRRNTNLCSKRYNVIPSKCTRYPDRFYRYAVGTIVFFQTVQFMRSNCFTEYCCLTNPSDVRLVCDEMDTAQLYRLLYNGSYRYKVGLFTINHGTLTRKGAFIDILVLQPRYIFSFVFFGRFRQPRPWRTCENK